MNKILKFIKSLGLELDEEIIKGIRKVGMLKIILGIVVFFIIQNLVLSFGSEDDLFKFYSISILVLIIFLVLLSQELKAVSKIKFLIDCGGQILALLISLVFTVTLIYGIITWVIDAFNWVINVFN
ncbi:hypothetical protein [Tenacibaculum aquimarinum]|uniref:hypothetical protein n=1 Tax=Tenacibaculum aquimarinum TaxID=2910675 RepID=UPI001F0B47DA|nr:hypothetical protein [Tenacibaculum aquimarinum]MCH3883497.1 hypothetical protein [Tenacibaculum aquimarinum]